MIELTPVDVRKKKGDFRRGLRGYEPALVDDFLDIVADRMEALVREAHALNERTARLEREVTDFRDREKAMTEALVSAQQMRAEIRAQSSREVEQMRREAEQEAEKIKADAVRAREMEDESLRDLRSRQLQFMATWRQFLQEELGGLGEIARTLELQVAGTSAATVVGPASSPIRSRVPGALAAEPAAPPPAASSPASQEPAKAARPDGPRAVEFDLDDDLHSLEAEAFDDEVILEVDEPVSTQTAAETTAAVTGSGPSDDDGLDDQLEDALARWGPDLDDEKPASAARAGAPAVAAVPANTEDDDLVAEMELLLSDDDMVPGTVRPAASHAEQIHEPAEDDLDDLADFFDLDEEDAETDAPRAPAAGGSPVVKAQHDLGGDVATAMGATSSDRNELIDLASVLGEDEADEADLDEAFGQPPSPTPSMADAMADLDDVFEETPDPYGRPYPAQRAEHDDRTATSGERMDADVLFGEPADDGDAYAARLSRDGNGDRSASRELDSYGLTGYNNAADGPGDTSSLTLHPMFFDQESPDLPGLLDRRSRTSDRSGWGSGEG